MVEVNNAERDWAEVKSKLTIGSIVYGDVLAHWHFGVFVSIDDCPFVGLIEIPYFREAGQSMTPREYPALNETIHAVVLGFRDRNHQVELSARPSDVKTAKTRPA